MIEFDNVRKSYRVGPVSFEVLKGVSFHIGAGELVAIMGASGSGKSTAMNILGLLDRPSSGVYCLEGTDVSQLGRASQAEIRNRKIGFVFQQFFLLGRMSALDNVAMPLGYRSMGRREMRERAEAYLDRVGLADRRQHLPSELSGGQRQRVAIARALVSEPSVILADEPTGALDSRIGQEIMDLFVELNRGDGITVVIITHDPRIASQCDRQMMLRDGLLTDDAAADPERRVS
jgi:putative ABC transport system ATP-binding protein